MSCLGRKQEAPHAGQDRDHNGENTVSGNRDEREQEQGSHRSLLPDTSFQQQSKPLSHALRISVLMQLRVCYTSVINRLQALYEHILSYLYIAESDRTIVEETILHLLVDKLIDKS